LKQNGASQQFALFPSGTITTGGSPEPDNSEQIAEKDIIPPAPVVRITKPPQPRPVPKQGIQPLDPLSAARERLHAVKDYVNNPSRSDKEKNVLLQELNKINDQIGAWANTGGSEQGSRQVRYTTLYPSMNRYYHQIAQEIGTPQTKDLTNYGLLTNTPIIRKTKEIEKEKIVSTKEQPSNPPIFNQPSQPKKSRTIVKRTPPPSIPITAIPNYLTGADKMSRQPTSGSKTYPDVGNSRLPSVLPKPSLTNWQSDSTITKVSFNKGDRFVFRGSFPKTHDQRLEERLSSLQEGSRLQSDLKGFSDIFKNSFSRSYILKQDISAGYKDQDKDITFIYFGDKEPYKLPKDLARDFLDTLKRKRNAN
ncbi:MAG: hypothetical protein AABX52_04255, partial [Nanoarchaeota archaeon]